VSKRYPFIGYLNLGNWKKSGGLGQVNTGLGKDNHRVFSAKLANQEGGVTGRIIVKKNPLAARSHFWPLLIHSFTQFS